MRIPFEIWASPEPTIARIDESTSRDQSRETGHDSRIGDLDLLASLGVTATRYPVLWEKASPESSDRVDLSWARARLERLRELDIEPVVTLLHHGSGPTRTSLVDPAFPESFAHYAGTVASAFPWIRRWTPINEPLTTARFSTLYGLWYPNTRDDDAAFGAAIVNEVLGILLAMEAIRERNPQAELVITEDLQGFTARDAGVAAFVAHKRERSFLSIELAMGRVRPGHALYAYLTQTCGVPPERLDRIVEHASAPALIGWNYYPNSERALSSGPDGTVLNEPARTYAAITPRPLLRAAHERLGLPFGISEVHINAGASERIAWFEARVDDLRALARDGLPVTMLGAWAAFGMVDWDSLLTRFEGVSEDGAFTFAGPGGTPQETALADCIRGYAAAARHTLARSGTRAFGDASERGSLPAGRVDIERTLASTVSFAEEARTFVNSAPSKRMSAE